MHIDTISMEFSSLYSKGFQAKLSIKLCISVPEDCFFISAKSADPDKIPPYAELHIGLHSLPMYLLNGRKRVKYQNDIINLGSSRMRFSRGYTA